MVTDHRWLSTPTAQTGIDMSYLFSIAFTLLAAAMQLQKSPTPHLNITEYIVSDTAKYESFRLKVINESDSVAIIERAQPSCGCILVTVQRAVARKGEPGEIYVAITSAKVPPLQPITVDVHTNLNRTPLRLVIKRPDPPDSTIQTPTSQTSTDQPKER
jgi:Protein of unknown function (DUF1573)